MVGRPAPARRAARRRCPRASPACARPKTTTTPSASRATPEAGPASRLRPACSPPTAAACCGARPPIPRPKYLLTNYHCIPETAPCANAEFVFHYWRTACNSGAAPTAWVGFRCDATVASFAQRQLRPLAGEPRLFAFLGARRPRRGLRLRQPRRHPSRRASASTSCSMPKAGPSRSPTAKAPTSRSTSSRRAGPFVITTPSIPRTAARRPDLPRQRRPAGRPPPLRRLRRAGVGNRGILMSDIYPAISPFTCTAGSS